MSFLNAMALGSDLLVNNLAPFSSLSAVIGGLFITVLPDCSLMILSLILGSLTPLAPSIKRSMVKSISSPNVLDMSSENLSMILSFIPNLGLLRLLTIFLDINLDLPSIPSAGVPTSPKRSFMSF